MKKTEASSIIKNLKKLSNPVNIEGMARFGIAVDKAFGVSKPKLRKMAKEIGKDHKLALKLWNAGYLESRILASLIDEPERVTPKQMDRWAGDFDSWDLCDQACSKLFVKTPFVEDKISQWAKDERPFVRRAAFANRAVAVPNEMVSMP